MYRADGFKPPKAFEELYRTEAVIRKRDQRVKCDVTRIDVEYTPEIYFRVDPITALSSGNQENLVIMKDILREKRMVMS